MWMSLCSADLGRDNDEAALLMEVSLALIEWKLWYTRFMVMRSTPTSAPVYPFFSI